MIYSFFFFVVCNFDNNVCKVIMYCGEKVVVFMVNGIEFICFF